jgi:hypothetical protein
MSLAEAGDHFRGRSVNGLGHGRPTFMFTMGQPAGAMISMLGMHVVG